MNVLSLLAHLSLLIHLGKDTQAIVQNLIQHKEKFPSTAEFVELIDDAVGLLSAGLINLPPDVLKTMQDALSQLKAGLQAV